MEEKRINKYDRIIEYDFYEIINSKKNNGNKVESILKNNFNMFLLSLLITIPLCVFGYYMYHRINGEVCDLFLSIETYLKAVIVFIIDLIIYKIIYFLLYALLEKNHFRSLKIACKRYGIIPVVIVKEALSKYKYVFNFIVPFIITGIGPIILGIHLYKKFYLVIGFVMIISLGVELLKVLKIIFSKYRRNIEFIDNPVNGDLILIEREDGI